MEKPFCKWKSCCILRIKKSLEKIHFISEQIQKDGKLEKIEKLKNVYIWLKLGELGFKKQFVL